MKILYFTGTGNSLYVAKKLGGDLISIPQAIKENNYHFSDDKIGIIFPTHHISIPKYIENFLKKVKLNSNYIFVIMTYGFFNAGAGSYVKRLTESYNIKLSYINAIKMVSNYLPSFEMTKQKKLESKLQIDNNLNAICYDINNSKQFIIKNSAISRFATNMSSKKKKKPGLSNKFHVQSDSCVKCAACIKVCPVNNVTLNSKGPQFGNKCISCLACVQNCFKSAIHLKGEKSSERFRNSQVSLNEIIRANE